MCCKNVAVFVSPTNDRERVKKLCTETPTVLMSSGYWYPWNNKKKLIHKTRVNARSETFYLASFFCEAWHATKYLKTLFKSPTPRETIEVVGFKSCLLWWNILDFKLTSQQHFSSSCYGCPRSTICDIIRENNER